LGLFALQVGKFRFKLRDTLNPVLFLEFCPTLPNFSLGFVQSLNPHLAASRPGRRNLIWGHRNEWTGQVPWIGWNRDSAHVLLRRPSAIRASIRELLGDTVAFSGLGHLPRNDSLGRSQAFDDVFLGFHVPRKCGDALIFDFQCFVWIDHQNRPSSSSFFSS
jgi:hypothetical protein